MEGNPTVRVLVCGSVKGKYPEFIKKVNSLKSKIDVVVAIGQFLGNNSIDVLQNQAKIDVPCFFFDPSAPSTTEVASNLSCVGKDGHVHFKGLDILFLSINNPIPPPPSKIDVLVADSYPESLFNHLEYNSVPSELRQVHGSNSITQLVTKFSPRYIFMPQSSLYYERPPFKNNANSITRFYAIADAFNTVQQKFLLALSISLSQAPSQDNVGENPFVAKHSIENKESEQPAKKQKSIVTPATTPTTTTTTTGQDSRFASTLSASSSGGYNRWGLSQTDVKSAKGASKVTMNRRADACWFCLSDPDAELHLVVSVANDMYLALAKGGINEDNALIVPVQHVDNMANLSDVAYKEIESYKAALVKCFAEQDKTVIFYERNLPPSKKGKLHTHLQAIPVPSALSPMIRDAFEKEGKKVQLYFDEIPEDLPYRNMVSASPYFYVEFDKTRLYGQIGNSKFPLQFGRQVISQLLNAKPDSDWRASVSTKEQETENVERFKKMFTPYDNCMSS